MFNKKTLVTYIFLFLVIVIFVLVSEGSNKTVKTVLAKMNLVPKKENFTELYFTDYSKLPTRSVAGENVNFSFTIHNHEGKEFPYTYSVYFEYPSGNRFPIKTAKVNLLDGEYANISINHKFSETNIYGKMVVKIDELNQSINFLLPNYN